MGPTCKQVHRPRDEHSVPQKYTHGWRVGFWGCGDHIDSAPDELRARALATRAARREKTRVRMLAKARAAGVPVRVAGHRVTGHYLLVYVAENYADHLAQPSKWKNDKPSLSVPCTQLRTFLTASYASFSS